MNINILLALTTTVLLTSGQILWKIGLNDISYNEDFLKLFLSLLKSVPIWAGAFLYVISTLLWFIVLKSAQFSKVYPILAASYILGMFAATIVFHEKVSIINWLGGGLIIAGIVLATWQN
ncbi:EamA family transporter [Pelosinus sp. IPA-1]|uniref:EamA family transporter n=1 Tax=Pelosinus sp. IPA-1 TaxID=3029569 RepID=UPI00243618E2|nr:EamA family transporter [Pelosinus sp. IPA-1]GMB01251.1 membrane protein [Pelosinus sp. IPA-1]